VTSKQINSSRSQWGFSLQPRQAWAAILGLGLFSALCLLAHAGSILRITYPLLSFGVGVFLYQRYPILYVGFTWWMWFLTPLVTRLVDFQSGWDPQRVMMVSPFLVTLLTLKTLFKNLPRACSLDGLPFILSLAGVFYGFMVGLVMNSPAAAVLSLLGWLVPISFGFHLFINWQDYPLYQKNIQRTFFWGLLVVGSYGVLQYVLAPEWDRFWLISSKLTSSAGKPEPFGFRVWSTMNEPAACGFLMLTGSLLLLINKKGFLYIPAAGAGYLCLLLTLVRAVWLGWVVGLFTLISSLKPQIQIRLIIGMMLIAICIVPLIAISPFSESISARFQSFSALDNDTSASDRKNLYSLLLGIALSEYLGQGLGGISGIDSGFLTVLLTLGWLGSIFYISGIFLLFLKLFQGYDYKSDSFASAARAISCGLFMIMPFFCSVISIYGMFFWGFLGVAMAAGKYHQYQRFFRAQAIQQS